MKVFENKVTQETSLFSLGALFFSRLVFTYENLFYEVKKYNCQRHDCQKIINFLLAASLLKRFEVVTLAGTEFWIYRRGQKSAY